MDHMNEHEDLFRRFRNFKLIQLILLIGIELAYFLVLFLMPSLREALYTNRILFTLSAMMWGVVIFSLICIFYDFNRMEKSLKENHLLSRTAYLDDLTGLPNRKSCDYIFLSYKEEHQLNNLGCGILRIDNLTDTNETLGHDEGDLLIKSFCKIAMEAAENLGQICRNSGNEFLVIIQDCTTQKMDSFFNDLDNRIKDYNASSSHTPLNVSYAYILNSEFHATRFTELIAYAYKKLHE